jgi:hypothetical protein
MKAGSLLLAFACWNLAAAVRFERVPDHGIQPQVVQQRDGVVHMIFFKGDPLGGNIYYAKKLPGASAFSNPIRVNQTDGSAIAIGTMRGPQLAIGKNGRAHVAWMGGSGARKIKVGGKEVPPMMYARLDDSGKAFEPEKGVISRVGGPDGGGSVTADSAGNVWVVWHGLAPSLDGESNRAIYVARSRDDGLNFEPEFKAATPTAGACACCGMKAFADDQGKLFIMFRGIHEQVNRPEQLLVSQDGGANFRTIFSDNWQTSTCPTSSVSIQPIRNGFLSAWETSGNVYAREVVDQRPGEVMSPERGPKRKFPFALENKNEEVLLTWVQDVGWGTEGKLGWLVYKNGHPTKEKGMEGKTPAWSFAQAYLDPLGNFVVLY